MTKRKIKRNISGLRDFSGATLEDIVDTLNEQVLGIRDALRELEKYKGEVEKNVNRLDEPDSIIRHIVHWSDVFHGFEYDFNRLIAEFPHGVEQRHLSIINSIYTQSKYEDQSSCDRFKHRHIYRSLKDESLRYLLDAIYRLAQGEFMNCFDLIGLKERLRSFIGSRLLAEGKKTKTKAIVPFHTPPGTGWNSISIHFISHETVQLVAGNLKEGRDYKECGFLDRRSGGYNYLWVFLATFAKCGGEIRWRTEGIDPGVKKNLKSNVSRLGKILTELFQIKTERPFKYSRRTGCYTAKFKVTICSEDVWEDLWSTRYPDREESFSKHCTVPPPKKEKFSISN